MQLSLADSFGPYLPLLPAFGWLFFTGPTGISSYEVSGAPVGAGFTVLVFFFLMYKGADIIHTPFLRYNVIFRITPGKDANGNDTFFCQTLLISGRTNVEPGTNSSLFTASKFTKLWNLKNVSKTKFWGTGTNFDMSKFEAYCKNGIGDLLGFPFNSGHVAVMMMEEIETDVDVDYKEEEGTNIAKYEMTSVKELSDWMRQFKKSRRTITA